MVEDGEIVEAFRCLILKPQQSPIAAGAGRGNSTGSGRPGGASCGLSGLCSYEVPVDYTWAKKLGMVRRNEGETVSKGENEGYE